MTFDQWKKQLYRLAKQLKQEYKLPGNNDLYTMFEQKLTPEQVVAKYLTSNQS